jgi:hypothetical protein
MEGSLRTSSVLCGRLGQGRTAKRFNRIEGRTRAVLDLLEGMAKDELLDWRDRIPLESALKIFFG